MQPPRCNRRGNPDPVSLRTPYHSRITQVASTAKAATLLRGLLLENRVGNKYFDSEPTIWEDRP